MNRGLKLMNMDHEVAISLEVANPDPMNRGLKLNIAIALISLFRVANPDPMNRGLKRY